MEYSNKMLNIGKNKLFGKTANIFSGFKVIFFVYRLFGIFPYSFSTKKELKIHRLESWLTFTAYQSFSLFLLAVWISKMEPNKLLKNPFMLLSLIRSIAYFTYTFLYVLNTKLNQNREAGIFKKLKKLNDVIHLKDKDVKAFNIYQTMNSVTSAIFFPVVLGLFVKDSENFTEICNNACVILTLGFSAAADVYLSDLILSVNMFLEKILEDLKKISHVFSRNFYRL